MQALVERFGSIHLDQMDEVSFMNRVDRKYCIHVAFLPELLKIIEPYYYCLEINGKRLFLYTNTYYDNQTNDMYNDHLRGKVDRYKIRIRNYDVSNVSYLEVKFKNNRGKTFKSRIKCNSEKNIASGALSEFLTNSTPFEPEKLNPVLGNKFHRVTMVSKQFNERCTIDFNLSFDLNGARKKLEGVAIIEVKSEGRTGSTPILTAIRDMHHKTKGFSKYCFGRSMLDHALKNNRYKPKIRTISKLQMMNKQL